MKDSGFSRRNFVHAMVAWFLVAATAMASAQTNAPVRFDMPVSHNPLSAYSADMLLLPISRILRCWGN